MKPYSSILAFVCGAFLFTSSAFAYQVNFTPSCSVQGEYTDNLLLTASKPEHDVITLFSVGFMLEAVGKKSGVSLDFNPAYNYYWRATEKSTFRQQFEFSAWVDILTKTTLEFKNNYMRTEDPFATIQIAPAPDEGALEPTDSTVRKGREPYYHNRAGVKLSHEFGAENSISGEYIRGILENEDPDIRDNADHNMALNLEYFFTPRIAAGAVVTYTRGEFEQSDDLNQLIGEFTLGWAFSKHLKGYAQYVQTYTDILGSGVDYDIYEPSIGVECSLPSDSRLNIGIGYYYTNLETDGKNSGGAIELDFQKRMENGSIYLSGSSGYSEAFFGAENLGFNTYYQIGCDANRQLLRRVGVHASCDYLDVNYGMVSGEREDRIFRFGADVNWQALEWLSIRLEYGFNEMDSSEDENDHEENRVTLEVRASPPTPYRLMD